MGQILTTGAVLPLVVLIAALALGGYFLARKRALASAKGDSRNLHSLPSYYGYNALMSVAVPALLVLGIWLLVQPMLVQSSVVDMIPASAVPEGSSVNLIMSDVRRLADGLDAAVSTGVIRADDATDLSAADDLRAWLAERGVALGADVSPEVLEAAQAYREMTATGNLWRNILVALIALVALMLVLRETNKDFRARNRSTGRK